MSAQSTIYNPSSTTSAATGDGFSCPRVSTGGRLAIPFGANDKGMMVYDVTLNSLFVWNGSAWELIDGTGTSSNTQVLFNDNGAPAGDPTMVFDKVTDTLTIQNLVVTGTTTALGGENASAIRAAASDYAAVTFDGATTGTRVLSTLTGQAIGTGDFSIWCRFKITQKLGGTVFSLVEDANNYFGLVSSSGVYVLSKTIGGVSSDGNITGFTGTAFAGQIVDFVLVRSAGVLSVYVNGSGYTLTNTTGNISLSAVANLRVGGYFVAAQVYDQPVYRSVIFNRALSGTDITQLITTGVNPADQWGTQTPVLNATFTGTTDSFIAAGAGVSVASVANQLEVTSTTPTGGGTLRASTVVPAKNYRIAFKVRLQSGDCSGTVRGAAAQFNPIGATTTLNFTPTAVLTQYLYEFNSASDTGLYFRLANTINPSVVELDDVVLERIGAIVDLDFTVGVGYQATDRSTNKLNGTLFNAVSWTMPQNSAILYATTAFAGDSLMLGTFSIPTNAIIENIIVNSPGAATVTIRDNSPGGTVIVNAAAVVAGRQKLTIAVPFSTNGNLWVNSSTASALQFTVVYNIAS